MNKMQENKNKIKAEAYKLKENYSWQELLNIFYFLRSDQGCPWDRKQTHQTLRTNMIEEAYEAIEAIDDEDPESLKDELGDVLLQVIFHSQIAEENHEFSIEDVINNLSQKLIRRHTHIFGEDQALTEEDALDTWAKNKIIEKGQKSAADSVEDIPKSFPALSKAYKTQKRAAKAGFDWEETESIIEKIQEELLEVANAKKELNETTFKNNAELNLEMEAGDLLFAVVNYLRHLRVDPEIALTRATEKFQKRFRKVEKLVYLSEREFEQLTLNELDEFWDKVKLEENNEIR